ncbi:MAG: hypothetical protein WBE26_13870 [Phycisphaerae bacterium]
MMTPLLTRRLYNQLLYEIESFKYQLRRLESYHYPTKVSLDLIGQLQTEIDDLATNAERIRDEYTDDPETVADLLANEHRRIAQTLLPLLGYIEHAQTRDVPWSFVQSIESLGAKIVPGRPVLTSVLNEHNYRILWYPNRKHLFLLLPRLHRLNVLWHTNVAHELFHAAIDEFFDAHIRDVTVRIVGACTDVLKNYDEYQGAPLFEKELGQRRLDLLSKGCLIVWRRAMEELLCDLGCACVFGPAAMMALLSMGLSYNLDAPPEAPSFYPPWRLRFRVVKKRVFDDSKKMLAKLAGTPEIAQPVEAFRRSLDEFDRLASSKGDRKAIEGDPLSKIAYDDRKAIEGDPLLKIAYTEVDRCLDAGWEYVQSVAAKERPSWRVTHEEVLDLLRRLQQHIPPSEIQTGDNSKPRFKPANIASILFAGWVFESHWHESEHSSSAEDQVDYTTVMRLILKGCEDAELRRSYDAAHIGFENT